jgi:hypothetical protein
MLAVGPQAESRRKRIARTEERWAKREDFMAVYLARKDQF